MAGPVFHLRGIINGPLVISLHVDERQSSDASTLAGLRTAITSGAVHIAFDQGTIKVPIRNLNQAHAIDGYAAIIEAVAVNTQGQSKPILLALD